MAAEAAAAAQVQVEQAALPAEPAGPARLQYPIWWHAPFWCVTQGGPAAQHISS